MALGKASFGAELSSAAYPPLISAGGFGDSFTPMVSADGRYVVFVSAAENLTTNDGNQFHDLFLRDRENFTTSLLGTNEAGVSSRVGHAGAPDISPDFGLIAYEETQFSYQPFFGSPVLRVTNTAGFLFDRSSGQRRSIGVADGVLLPQISDDPPHTNWLTFAIPMVTGLQFTADGHRVIFGTPGSYAGFQPNLARSELLFELDLDSGITNRFWAVVPPATVPNAEIQGVSLSADGERAAFFSAANNLHPLDGWQNGSRYDVFVYDRTANSNLLVSIAADGSRGGSNNSEAPDISGDGRFVVFTSTATNLVPADTNHNADVFLRDLATETTILVSSNLAGFTGPASGSSSAPAISRDGRWIAFFSNASDLVADDPNGASGDVFLRDYETGVVTRISNHPDWRGRLATTAHAPQLSFDGSFVLYQAPGSGLFLYERESGVNHRLTDDVTADSPSMSPDGRFVVFSSHSVPGPIGGMDTHRQIYLFDRELDSFELISVRDQSQPVQAANDASRFEAGVVATADDLLLVRSYATDLGLRADERKLRLWNLASASLPLEVDLGRLDGTPVEIPKVVNLTANADGRWLAFDYDEPVLGDAYTNSGWHVVLHDRQSGINRVLNHTTGSYRGPQFPAIASDGTKVVWRPSASELDLYDIASGALTHIISNDSGFGAGEAPVFHPDNRSLFFRYRGPAIPGFSEASIPNWRLFEFWFDSASFRKVDPLALESAEEEVVSARLMPGDRIALMEIRESSGVSNIYFDSQLLLTNAFNPVLGSQILIAFESTQTRGALRDANEVADVFVWNRVLNTPWGGESLVSVNHAGTGAGNGRSRLLDLSPDGRFVLFHSWAGDLVAHDDNSVGDLFLRDLRTQTTLLLSVGQQRAAEGHTSARAMFNRAGTKIIFESYARNLAAGDFNETRDVFAATLSLPDSDGDGLPDSWELTWFGTLDPDGTADTDGDSASDGDEFIAGTSPINDRSIFAALPIRSSSGGEPVILWAAVPGRTYRVQFKDDFNVPGWATLPGDVVADSSTGRKLDETGAGGPHRFYRVQVLP